MYTTIYLVMPNPVNDQLLREELSRSHPGVKGIHLKDIDNVRHYGIVIVTETAPTETLLQAVINLHDPFAKTIHQRSLEIQNAAADNLTNLPVYSTMTHQEMRLFFDEQVFQKITSATTIVALKTVLTTMATVMKGLAEMVFSMRDIRYPGLIQQ